MRYSCIICFIGEEMVDEKAAFSRIENKIKASDSYLSIARKSMKNLKLKRKQEKRHSNFE